MVAHRAAFFSINQNGNVRFDANIKNSQGQSEYFLYRARTRYGLNLSSLGTPGGTIMPSAMIDKDQVVGNHLIYTNRTRQTLPSLIPQNSGWSALNATAINDEGDIVGAGVYNGQSVASLMTPDAVSMPEPGDLGI